MDNTILNDKERTVKTLKDSAFYFKEAIMQILHVKLQVLYLERGL
jgi:hypothetical protein